MLGWTKAKDNLYLKPESFYPNYDIGILDNNKFVLIDIKEYALLKGDTISFNYDSDNKSLIHFSGPMITSLVLENAEKLK